MEHNVQINDDENPCEDHDDEIVQENLEKFQFFLEASSVKVKDVSQYDRYVWQDGNQVHFYLIIVWAINSESIYDACRQVLQYSQTLNSNYMITSSKGDFRINLNLYSSLNSTPRPLRKNISFRMRRSTNNRNDSITEKSLNFSSILENEKIEQLRKISRRTMILYNRNLQFYHHNEQKLIKAIENEIKQKNYTQQKDIVKFITTKEQFHIKNTVNLQKLQQQFELLNKFLEDLYEKKRIKQILILNQNLKEQENEIADKVSLDELNFMNQNLELTEYSFTNDFIGQYQNICLKFGLAEPYLKSHIHIRNQIDSSRQEINNYIEMKKKNKAKYIHLRKKRRQ